MDGMAAFGDVEPVRTPGALADIKNPSMQRLGVSMSREGVEGARHVTQRRNCLRMRLTEGFFVDLVRLLQRRTGVIEAALGTEGLTKKALRRGGVRMVRAARSEIMTPPSP